MEHVSFLESTKASLNNLSEQFNSRVIRPYKLMESMKSFKSNRSKTSSFGNIYSKVNVNQRNFIGVRSRRSKSNWLSDLSNRSKTRHGLQVNLYQDSYDLNLRAEQGE